MIIGLLFDYKVERFLCDYKVKILCDYEVYFD